MRFISILILFVFILGSCRSSKVEALVKATDAQGDYFEGFVLFDPDRNDVLVDVNGHHRFTPASNTKLVTFYAGYRTLEDSIKSLEYAVHKDTLYIKGTADPMLLYLKDSSKVIDFLQSREEPIVLLEENIEDDRFGSGWSWGDYQYYYMPEKNLFPVFGNIVNYKMEEGQLRVKPELFTPSVHLDSVATVNRKFDENEFYLKRPAQSYNIPFITSSALTASLLSEATGKKITTGYKKDLEYKTLRASHRDSVLKHMLMVSDNFIAEQVLLQVGKEVAGTYEVGKAISYSLEHYFPGLPDKPRWVDGSGLSRYNLFSPHDMVYILRKMHAEIPEDELLHFLPAGGKSGTIRNFYKNDTPYVFAKTGTLSNNHCLSGYLKTKSGKLLIFSYMNNHYMQSNNRIKEIMEGVLKTIYNKY